MQGDIILWALAVVRAVIVSIAVVLAIFLVSLSGSERNSKKTLSLFLSLAKLQEYLMGKKPLL
jgi:hypothetical protein